MSAIVKEYVTVLACVLYVCFFVFNMMFLQHKSVYFMCPIALKYTGIVCMLVF